MSYSLVFDFGTTSVKGVLISSEGDIINSAERELITISNEKIFEQYLDQHWNAFKYLMEVLVHEIIEEDLYLIMSGQMQDLICIDKDGYPIGNMILYSDTRAEKENKIIIEDIGFEKINNIIKNNFNASLVAPKILWVKENLEGANTEINKFLFSPKDYILFKLTGKTIVDPTNASTTGLFEFDKKEYNNEIIDKLGFDISMYPTVTNTLEFIDEIEWINGQRIKVYSGIGDAGAATLASGVKESGQANIHLGTTGWISTITDSANDASTDFQLIDYSSEKVIVTIPFFNAGNIHKWANKAFSSGDYDLTEEAIKLKNDILFLPYISGERFPVLDSDIRGGFYGVSANTVREDFISSSLEGVAFSIKQGFEKLDSDINEISIIGGGARSKKWMQIFSNILEAEIKVYLNSEFLPALSLAGIVFDINNDIKNFDAWIEGIRKFYICKPNIDKEYVDEKYNRYKKLYYSFSMLKM